MNFMSKLGDYHQCIFLLYAKILKLLTNPRFETLLVTSILDKRYTIYIQIQVKNIEQPLQFKKKKLKLVED